MALHLRRYKLILKNQGYSQDYYHLCIKKLNDIDGMPGNRISNPKKFLKHLIKQLNISSLILPLPKIGIIFINNPE